MVYPIYVFGHPVLRKVSEDFVLNDPSVNDLINNMFETMYRAEGIGLAAPQVGISKRLFIVDGEPLGEDEPELRDFKRVFINAHITERSGEKVVMDEGCLSIPNIREEVNRESTIRIKYFDENWNPHDEVIEGYRARIIQHEYDHLDGILFTDKINPLRKRMVRGKLNAISRGKFDADYKTLLPAKKKI